MKALARFIVWTARIVILALRQALRQSGRGLLAYGKWLRTPAGITFWSAFALVCVIGGLWLAERRMDSAKARLQPAESDQTTMPTVPDPVLAKAGNRAFRLSDVTAYGQQKGIVQAGETLTRTDPRMPSLLEDALDEYLLAEAARRSPSARRADVQANLAAARNRILAAAYLDDLVAAEVTDERVREFYDSRAAQIAYGEEVRLRKIVVKDAKLAADLMNALRDGVEFDEIVSKYSEDEESRARGGHTDYLARAQMPVEISDLAFELDRGEMAGPVETADGWVIVKVTGRRLAGVPPFGEIKGEIRDFLKYDAISRERQRLREAAEISLPPESPGAKTAPPAAKDENLPKGLR